MKSTTDLKNALLTLGVDYEECGEYLYEYTICGVHFQDESDLIWCGLFGFSYTGVPLDEMQRIYEVLNIFHNGKNIDDTQYIYAYLLESWGFTDYGFSICKQELTDKGKALYCLMQSYYDAYER